MTKIKCSLCDKEFSIKGMNSHFWSIHTEEGRKFRKAKRAPLSENKKIWNRGLTKETDERVKKRGENLSKNYSEGKTISYWLGKHHSIETKNILREKALNSTHRRIKRKTILYNNILLDSKYELEVAKNLDKNKVKWIRPEPFKYIDFENKTHQIQKMII